MSNKSRQRPIHSFIPSDEDRNVAILQVARDAKNLPAKFSLPQHFATFRRVGHRVLITYTPFNSKNQQSSDWVNLSTAQASSM